MKMRCDPIVYFSPGLCLKEFESFEAKEKFEAKKNACQLIPHCF